MTPLQHAWISAQLRAHRQASYQLAHQAEWLTPPRLFSDHLRWQSAMADAIAVFQFTCDLSAEWRARGLLPW